MESPGEEIAGGEVDNIDIVNKGARQVERVTEKAVVELSSIYVDDEEVRQTGSVAEEVVDKELDNVGAVNEEVGLMPVIEIFEEEIVDASKFEQLKENEETENKGNEDRVTECKEAYNKEKGNSKVT